MLSIELEGSRPCLLEDPGDARFQRLAPNRGEALPRRLLDTGAPILVGLGPLREHHARVNILPSLSMEIVRVRRVCPCRNS
jgi:hypothetical protein